MQYPRLNPSDILIAAASAACDPTGEVAAGSLFSGIIAWFTSKNKETGLKDKELENDEDEHDVDHARDIDDLALLVVPASDSHGFS